MRLLYLKPPISGCAKERVSCTHIHTPGSWYQAVRSPLHNSKLAKTTISKHQKVKGKFAALQMPVILQSKWMHEREESMQHIPFQTAVEHHHHACYCCTVWSEQLTHLTRAWLGCQEGNSALLAQHPTKKGVLFYFTPHKDGFLEVFQTPWSHQLEWANSLPAGKQMRPLHCLASRRMSVNMKR